MQLIVFSGLPGTGKSGLAEAVARRLAIPGFAKDHVEAAVLRSGLAREADERRLGMAGYDVLTSLAERQLQLGQSAILDSVASTTTIRDVWRGTARAFGAEWRVIECICSAETVHRARLATRERNIPAWPELEWSEVERVRGNYEHWLDDRLVVDAVDPLPDNLERALGYLSSDSEGLPTARNPRG